MRELVVLRHAQALPAGRGEDDAARVLGAHGEAQARAVGAWLAGRGLRPDLVLCSSARRARDTAAGVLAALDPAPPVTQLDALYGATSGELLAVLSRHVHADRILLVGHNPGLEQLVAILCPSAPPNGMPPAGLAHILLEGPAEPGCGRLQAFRPG